MTLTWSPSQRLTDDDPPTAYLHWAATRHVAEATDPNSAAAAVFAELSFLTVHADPVGGLQVKVVTPQKREPGLPIQLPVGDRFIDRSLPEDAPPRSGPAPDVRQILPRLGTVVNSRNFVMPVSLSEDMITRDAASAPLGRGRPARALPAGSVIVGVIDDGIAFAHERFRSSQTASRVEYVWLQDVPAAPPSDVPIGRELDRAEIDVLLAAFAVGGDVDEESLYREVGLIDPSVDKVQTASHRHSHGTAVLDVAAGYPMGDPAGDQIRIIAVSLPSDVTADMHGGHLDVHIALGIQRILLHAERLAAATGEDVPVIINISYALTAGPKDGTGLVTGFMVEALAQRPAGRKPLHFVLPAGNHRQSRTCAQLSLPRDAVLHWRLLPDDLTPSFVEIWLPRVSKRPKGPSYFPDICPPGDGAQIPTTAAFNTFHDLAAASGPPLARAYFFWTPESQTNPKGPGRESIVLAVPPTAPDAPGRATAPAGDWRIELVPLTASPVPLEVNAYVQRDESLAGYRRAGRQSYFVDDRYADYDPTGRLHSDDIGNRSLVRRAGTLNAFAASPVLGVVGAKARLSAADMPYSGLGPVPGRPQPIAARVADESVVHRGLLVAGSRSGSTVAVSGTSMAAPSETRRLADMLRGPSPIGGQTARPGRPPRILQN